MSMESISADDPGGGRARLYALLQREGYGRNRALFVSQRFFPAGAGLNWRYETLRGRYGLSPDAARLVISIEEGKGYSESALWTARHREREAVKAILARPAREASMPSEVYKLLREMFPTARKVRLSRELADYWPSALAAFFTEKGFLGKLITIPSPPPRCKVFEGFSPSSPPNFM